MTYVILFIITSVISGFLLTYFLSAGSSLNNIQPSIVNPHLFNYHLSQGGMQFSILERLTYGVVIGLGLSTWLVFLFSLFFGLQYKSILASILLLVTFCLLFLRLRWAYLKAGILNEVVEIKDDFLCDKLSYFVHMAFFLFFATIFLRLFYRVIIWHDGAMFVGLLNNYGDLPLHLAYITSFVWGDNIPPIDPSFAGEKLAYPILSDFMSAIFLKLGLGFKDILLIPGFLLTTAFYGILYYFVYRLTKKRVAAIIAEFIFFFAGGFGFYYFFQDIANSSEGFWWFLTNLSKDYTKIEPLNYHWITPLTCLNVPQRPFLFGFPITMLIFTLLFTGLEIKRRGAGVGVGEDGSVGNRPLAVGGVPKTNGNVNGWQQFLFAGVLAGSLPFFHTHSFLAMVMVTLLLAVIFWDWRRWFLFFCPAFILSLPQVIYFSGHVGGGSFFKYSLGWMAGDENILWFWLKNTGLFWIAYIGALIVILVTRMQKQTVKQTVSFPICFVLPFLILFFLPNIMLFAPWNWDNIKMLIYWFLGSMPLVAFALSLLYEREKYKFFFRSLFFIIMFFLTIAGGIDVFRYAIAPINGWKEFSCEEMDLAKRISANTEPDALFLNAPVHNHPVFLSGRKSLMGYPGHIWSHGYKGANDREQDIRKMLKGDDDLVQIDGKLKPIPLIEKHKPDYAIIGPHERRFGVNKRFFDIKFKLIMSTDNYYVYDLNKRLLFDAASVGREKKELITHGYGLSATYYPNIEWQGEWVFKEVDTYISFNWPTEELKPIKSPFSTKWEGYIDILQQGEYMFKLVSDDGSWLYIDDELVIDNGGYHAIKTATGRVNLESGKHKITVKYFDSGGGAVMQLLWIPPEEEEAEIPVERLRVKG